MSYRLFLIIPPGLEDLALREVREKCPVLSDIAHTKGGLEVEADLDWIVRAHCLLKIPVRLLMRIKDFKVKDFPKLHQKFSALPWNEFLSHPEPEFEIACAKSRLMHTGRMEETVKDALADYLKRQPLSLDWKKKNYPRQKFYIRIVDDHLTLSLDLTGEPLYKRGLQKIKGEAPLRENLAAALLAELLEGIHEQVLLIDPMCGSGTFLSEALNWGVPLHKRAFLFETAPFFKGKIVRLPKEVNGLPVRAVKGFDVNEELLDKVKAQLPLDLSSLDTASTPLNIPGDFVMICNPPYGERIKISGKRGSFLREVFHKFLTVDKPKRFGWVLPSDMDDLFSPPENWGIRSRRSFRNGGLAVTFWVFERGT